jgi:hypothetical protein
METTTTRKPRRKYRFATRHEAEEACKDAENNGHLWQLAARTLADMRAMNDVRQFTSANWAAAVILRHPHSHDWLAQGAIVLVSAPNGCTDAYWVDQWRLPTFYQNEALEDLYGQVKTYVYQNYCVGN